MNGQGKTHLRASDPDDFSIDAPSGPGLPVTLGIGYLAAAMIAGIIYLEGFSLVTTALVFWLGGGVTSVATAAAFQMSSLGLMSKPHDDWSARSIETEVEAWDEDAHLEAFEADLRRDSSETRRQRSDRREYEDRRRSG